MKKADVQIGAEVAIAFGYNDRRRLGEKFGLTRATVLAIVNHGEPEPEDGGRDAWRSRDARRRRTVRVRIEEGINTTRPAGSEQYAEPRQILATWAEYQDAKAETERDRERAREERERSLQKQRDDYAAIAEALQALGLTELAENLPSYPRPYDTIRIGLTANDLARVIAAAKGPTPPEEG